MLAMHRMKPYGALDCFGSIALANMEPTIGGAVVLAIVGSKMAQCRFVACRCVRKQNADATDLLGDVQNVLDTII